MKARMYASRKASEASSNEHDVKRLAALLAGLEVEVKVEAETGEGGVSWLAVRALDDHIKYSKPGHIDRRRRS
jgi:predicted thioesterase